MAPSGPETPAVSLQRERERAVELLGQHFAHDNISMEELERRIELAYRAPSVQDLRGLLQDLPSGETALAPRPEAPVPELYATEEGRVVSIMGQTTRGGVWQPPRRLNVWSVMSETRLDLTEALLPSGVTEIDLHGIMTQIKIIVPPGVRVVSQVSAFMAEVADETSDPPPVGSGAPVVRVTGFVFMAELRILVRRRELLGDLPP